MIQDGTEIWTENSLDEAIYSVISAARILNGSYIRKDDIKIKEQDYDKKHKIEVTAEEYDLLEKIKTKHKCVLDYNDPRIKYRISEEECEMIVKIREGVLKIN